MTELLVSRGDTFPRTFLDSYRGNKQSRASEQLYNELKASKSDELVLQNPVGIPVPTEMHHGHSENILDAPSCASPTEADFLDKPDVILLPAPRRHVPYYDRVDPEDSIRDIVTENDFYRFVLFKKHYDKYLNLAQKYEEARNIAYYLEEKYHELKLERDCLIRSREQLAKRLEANECQMREKEDEVFVQLERVVYLEEQCEKLKFEKEKYCQQKIQFEKEKNEAYRLLKDEAEQSERTRRTLERARQEIVHHMTKINTEKEMLARENDKLKETLEAERRGVSRYLGSFSIPRKRNTTNTTDSDCSDKQLLVAKQNADLSSQFQKGMRHLASCRRRKCCVCQYTKAAFGDIGPSHSRYDRKLLSCLQTPFLEMRNMIKPTSSPINSEGESLSEFFRPLSSSPTLPSSSVSSLSVPFADLAISYMDDCSSTGSTTSGCHEDRTVTSWQGNEDEATDSQAIVPYPGSVSAGGKGGGAFGSDSGFSSDICTECKSLVATSKEKFCPKATLDEVDCAKLQRTKWTASFRKLIKKVRK